MKQLGPEIEEVDIQNRAEVNLKELFRNFDVITRISVVGTYDYGELSLGIESDGTISWIKSCTGQNLNLYTGILPLHVVKKDTFRVLVNIPFLEITAPIKIRAAGYRYNDNDHLTARCNRTYKVTVFRNKKNQGYFQITKEKIEFISNE